MVFRIVGKHSTKSLPRLNQQCSPLYFLLRHNLKKKQKEGDNADEDEQVAEDEELAADVEGVPQAQPELLHLGRKYPVAHLEGVPTFGNSLFALYSCSRIILMKSMCYCGSHLDHFSGDGNLLAHLAVVLVDHPGNEGDVVHQVVDGHHNLSLRHWSRIKHLEIYFKVGKK